MANYYHSKVLTLDFGQCWQGKKKSSSAKEAKSIERTSFYESCLLLNALLQSSQPSRAILCPFHPIQGTPPYVASIASHLAPEGEWGEDEEKELL